MLVNSKSLSIQVFKKEEFRARFKYRPGKLSKIDKVVCRPVPLNTLQLYSLES